MYPGYLYWRKLQGAGEHGGWAEARCGSGRHHPESRGWEASHGDDGGGSFGVRRPLRFLAYKLDLDETQVNELAKILNDLKTERAQAEVDGRRTVSAFADAVAGEAFDQVKAGDGATLRVKSAERLKDAVVAALGRIHAILQPDQRVRLAYLIRTGVVSL